MSLTLKFMDRIKKRNLIGIIGWLVISFVINILALILMILRECKQKEELGLSEIEWDDILRYTITILLGSCIQGLVIQYLLS